MEYIVVVNTVKYKVVKSKKKLCVCRMRSCVKMLLLSHLLCTFRIKAELNILICCGDTVQINYQLHIRNTIYYATKFSMAGLMSVIFVTV